ncbi:hypothetical protein C8R46DRAFT_816763, partial [Mycena filopes]
PTITTRASPTPCDLLAEETMSAVQTDEDATLNLYGGVAEVNPRHVMVHLASACKNGGKVDVRAAFGVYWGEDSTHNNGWLIPGRQVDARAVMLGILHAICVTNPDRTLEIFTTSKYAIRAICYAAGRNHTTGWDCANGDLLELIANAIQSRRSRVAFHCVLNPHSNSSHGRARKLA